MKITEHIIGPSRHSTDTIMEVSDWASGHSDDEELAGYQGDGFYFVDETEASVYGPYKSVEEATRHRNEYWAQL